MYPSPNRIVSLFMYVIHNKTKHLIVRVGGMVKKQERFYPKQIFFYSQKSQIFLSTALALIENENDFLHTMYKIFVWTNLLE